MSASLAGSVAFVDGKLYPLRSFECQVETNTERLRSGLGTKDNIVTTGTEISGTIETYREIAMPAHIGTPETHDVYLFGEQKGTDERVYLESVLFEPKPAMNNNQTQTVDFIAKEIQHD